MAELAASDAGRQAEVADGDLLVHPLVREAVGALGHGANEDADALLRGQRVHVVPDLDERGVEAQRHLPAVGRQVVRDGVLDDAEELLLGVCGPDR